MIKYITNITTTFTTIINKNSWIGNDNIEVLKDGLVMIILFVAIAFGFTSVLLFAAIIEKMFNL